MPTDRNALTGREPRRQPGTRARPVRRFRDDRLTEWSAYERLCGTGTHAAIRLVFESETLIRTLDDFPSDWARLSDEDLFVLLQRPAR